MEDEQGKAPSRKPKKPRAKRKKAEPITLRSSPPAAPAPEVAEPPAPAAEIVHAPPPSSRRPGAPSLSRRFRTLSGEGDRLPRPAARERTRPPSDEVTAGKARRSTRAPEEQPASSRPEVPARRTLPSLNDSTPPPSDQPVRVDIASAAPPSSDEVLVASGDLEPASAAADGRYRSPEAAQLVADLFGPPSTPPPTPETRSTPGRYAYDEDEAYEDDTGSEPEIDLSGLDPDLGLPSSLRPDDDQDPPPRASVPARSGGTLQMISARPPASTSPPRDSGQPTPSTLPAPASEPPAPRRSERPVRDSQLPKELEALLGGGEEAEVEASEPAPRARAPEPDRALAESDRPKRGRWRRFALGAAVGALLATVAVTLLPMFMLSQLEKRANACFAELRARAEGDPGSCPPTGAWLALPLRLPWFERDALQLRVNGEHRAAQLEYAKATAIAPDAARRSETAERVRALGASVLEPEDTVSPLETLPGAFEELTAFALDSDDKRLRAHAFYAARAIGRLDALGALSAGGDASEHFALNLRRGAILCLLGDAAAGEQALLAADKAHMSLYRSEGLGPARLALIACSGGTEPIDGVDPRELRPALRSALVALEASFGTIESSDQARMFLHDPKAVVAGGARMRLAPVVVRETKPSALETLLLLAPQNHPVASFDASALRTPWHLLDALRSVEWVRVDPDSSEGAGDYLEQMLPGVTAGALACLGEECPVEMALKLPRPMIAEAARVFWLQAAAEWAQRGNRERTLAALAHATALASPRRKHESAPVHLAVGDAEGAIALSAIDAALPPAEQARIALNHGLALAHLGRFPEAYKAARTAYLAAVAAESSADDERASGAFDAAVVQKEDRAAAAWLWGATAVEIDKVREILPLLRENRYEETALLTHWLELAIAPEEERRKERWDLAMREPPAGALPAAMFIASRAVPQSSDVEVWLDRVFDDEHRQQPVRAMLARAEAARWRGAEEAERLWQGRAQRMRALVTDFRSSLLAHVAELL